jgi:ribosome-associated protein
MATKKTAAKAKRTPARKPAPRGAARKGAPKRGAPKGALKGALKGAPKKGPQRKALIRTGSGRKARPAKPGLPRKAAALAPPAHAAAAPGPARPDPARPTAIMIAHAGLDKKAEDVTVLDVRGLTSYADYFVVMTADSDRQAGAIADHVEQTMKDKGVTKVGVEGYEGGRWILVDYGDVVAHVMNRESRGFYDLEGLWADAPRFPVND